MERTLLFIMSDMDAFLAFASDGRFTAPDLPYVPANPDFDLLAGLNTFVTSKLMQSDNYYAIPGDVVNQTTADATAASNKRQYYYWSPSTHRQYELRYKGNPPMDISTLVTHVQNDHWADEQLLFDGGYNCTAEGKAGGMVVSQLPDGAVDVSCVSQLPMVSGDLELPYPSTDMLY